MSVAWVALVGCGDDEATGGASDDVCEEQTVELEQADDGSGVFRRTEPIDDEQLTSAVAASFCAPWTLAYRIDDQDQVVPAAPNPILPAEEAMCLGRGLVDELGAERVRQLGLDVEPWSTLGFALRNREADPPLKRPEADSMVAVIEGCTGAWKQVMFMTLTEGTDRISDESAACTAETLRDEDARVLFASELDRAYDDPSQPDAAPFPEVVQPLLDAFDECLTFEELDRLDFN
jgi:hypothetical protein